MTKLDEQLTTLAPLLQAYIDESAAGVKPAVKLRPMQELAADLQLRNWIEEGGLKGGELTEFVQLFFDNTTRLRAPGFLAHQTGSSTDSGVIASLLDGLVNNPMNIYEMGPATATIEYVIINWMLEKVGWTPAPWPQQLTQQNTSAAGVLTHGGSLGNLTALLSARTHIAPEAWEEGVGSDLILLASEQSHYSVSRSAGLLGLGRKQIINVPTRADGVIDVYKLADYIEEQQQQGKRIIALIANACSTAAGLFDPIRPIAEICKRTGVWLHVDGAHGASVLLSDKLACQLDGIELADSLVWDAHKLMQTPPLCTAVLVKNGLAMDKAFEQEASYLFHEKQQPGFDFIGRTVECTRSGHALKLFMTLAEKGEKQLGKDIEYGVDLASQAYELIQRSEGFSCPVEPQSNILCFEYVGAEPIQIRDALIAEGSFHLSTSNYMGKRYLRMVFMHRNTKIEDIKRLLKMIKKIA
ncbi:MAG: pyridoxal phosphate-dependent decarboxylase family protein [bacterium]